MLKSHFIIALLATGSIIACGNSGGSSGRSGPGPVAVDRGTATATETIVDGAATIVWSASAGGETYEYTTAQRNVSRRQAINGNTYYIVGRLTSGGYAAFGGVTTDGSTASFLGQSGTLVTPANTTGVVEYRGNFSYATFANAGSSATTIAANYNQMSINELTGALDITAGTISGNTVSGTATYGGITGDFQGGFYQGGEGLGDELNFVVEGDDGLGIIIVTTTGPAPTTP